MTPCSNGGSCLNVPEGNYKCNCKSGWTGKHCEVCKYIFSLTNFDKLILLVIVNSHGMLHHKPCTKTFSKFLWDIVYVLSNTKSSRCVLLIVWDSVPSRLKSFSSSILMRRVCTLSRHQRTPSSPVLHCVISPIFRFSFCLQTLCGQSLPLSAAGARAHFALHYLFHVNTWRLRFVMYQPTPLFSIYSCFGKRLSKRKVRAFATMPKGSMGDIQ